MGARGEGRNDESMSVGTCRPDAKGNTAVSILSQGVSRPRGAPPAQAVVELKVVACECKELLGRCSFEETRCSQPNLMRHRRELPIVIAPPHPEHSPLLTSSATFFI